MAVTGDPDEIRRYGVLFRGIPQEGQPLALRKALYLDGGLSGGLAGAQDDVAIAAEEFVRSMNAGIAAVGEGLVRIGEHVTEFDQRGRDAITRLFSGGR